MNGIVRTVYIVHLAGIPLVSVNLDGSARDNRQSFEELFGGFTSAINNLVKELGHEELKAIESGNGLLVYSSRDPVLFVVHVEKQEYDQFAKILVKQIENQFFQEFEGHLQKEEAYVRGERYQRFKSNIRDLYNHLMRIRNDYPEIIQFLPSVIPLSQLYMVLNLGLDIIQNFPEDTIKLVRELNNYFGNQPELEDLVARTIGRYAGYRIAKAEYKDKLVIQQSELLDLLNEISVTKFDSDKEVYDIVLCPVCRGKTANRPICHFFSGFIEGVLRNPSISVEETSCRAMGNKSCEFALHRD
ncbi:hypothetical protein EU537_04765 [Candidatus Thorarchaeota archaeon]|nr:MAG: hypothetical protein EU537_04765 [Candidatus Thorarchaeota archaeon]